MKTITLLAVVLTFSYFTYRHGWDRGYVSATATVGAAADLAVRTIRICTKGVTFE